MKRHIIQIASAFILAAMLLVGCGSLPNRSLADAGQVAVRQAIMTTAAQSAAKQAIAVTAARSAAKSAAAAIGGSTSQSNNMTLSWLKPPFGVSKTARAADQSPGLVSRWWQGLYAKFFPTNNPAAGAGRLLEFQPQPR